MHIDINIPSIEMKIISNHKFYITVIYLNKNIKNRQASFEGNYFGIRKVPFNMFLNIAHL